MTEHMNFVVTAECLKNMHCSCTFVSQHIMQLPSKLKDFAEVFLMVLPHSIKRGKISSTSIFTNMVMIWTLRGTSLQCHMAEVCDGTGDKLKS
jgi:hypothetical protein